MKHKAILLALGPYTDSRGRRLWDVLRKHKVRFRSKNTVLVGARGSRAYVWYFGVRESWMYECVCEEAIRIFDARLVPYKKRRPSAMEDVTGKATVLELSEELTWLVDLIQRNVPREERLHASYYDTCLAWLDVYLQTHPLDALECVLRVGGFGVMNRTLIERGWRFHPRRGWVAPL